MYTHTHMYACIYIYIYMYSLICLFNDLCMRVWPSMYIYIYMYMYIDSCTENWSCPASRLPPAVDSAPQGKAQELPIAQPGQPNLRTYHEGVVSGIFLNRQKK